jgi:hypothetical protein
MSREKRIEAIQTCLFGHILELDYARSEYIRDFTLKVSQIQPVKTSPET